MQGAVGFDGMVDLSMDRESVRWYSSFVLQIEPQHIFDLMRALLRYRRAEKSPYCYFVISQQKVFSVCKPLYSRS